MNNKRYIMLKCFFFFITSFSFSQSTINKRLVDLENIEQTSLTHNTQITYYSFYETKNIKLIIEGSPFNNNDNPQIDSVVISKILYEDNYETIKYFYEYDSLGNVSTEIKTNNFRLFYEYDSDGNQIKLVWEIWENNQWVNYGLSTKEYDSRGNIILGLFQRWNDTNWGNSSQTKYFYNYNEDLSYYIREDWDGNTWVNSFKVTLTYDSNYLVISRLNQNWGGNDWNGYTWRNTYSYDSNGNLILHLSEDLINGQWVNAIRWRYEYDENNNKILTYYDYWEDGKWKDYYRWTQDFDNNGNVVWYLEEVYDSGKWTNTYQTFSTYNSEGHFIYAKSERWIESDSIWVPGNEGVFIYDVDGNRRSYFGSEIKVYYHDESTGITTNEYQPNNFFLSQNYPNPFNPVTTINFDVAKSTHVKLEVYNVLGQKVATLVNESKSPGRYAVEFGTNNLPSGIYIYQIEMDDYISTMKMILMK